MRGDVFVYLEKKIMNEYGNCGWSDDLSRRFSGKELQEMTESLRDMASTERKVKDFMEEARRKLRNYD